MRKKQRSTLKARLALLVLLGLAGCATTDPHPEQRQAEIATRTRCAQSTEVDAYISAQCAVSLATWAINGWGTSDRSPDRKQYYFWMHKAAEKGSISAAVRLAVPYVLHFATENMNPIRPLN